MYLHKSIRTELQFAARAEGEPRQILSDCFVLQIGSSLQRALLGLSLPIAYHTYDLLTITYHVWPTYALRLLSLPNAYHAYDN